MARPNKITIRITPARFTENRAVRVTGLAGRIPLTDLNLDQLAVPLTPGTTGQQYVVNVLTEILAAYTA